MCLVDDDNRATATLCEVSKSIVEAFAEATGVESGADVPGRKDEGKERLDGQVRVGQVGGEVEVRVKGVDESANSGRFTRADVTGDQRREAILEGESEAGLDFLVSGGGKEVADR
jgi:hypothetical protein